MAETKAKAPQAGGKGAKAAADTVAPAVEHTDEFKVGLTEGKPSTAHRLPFVILSFMSALLLLAAIIYWLVM